MFNLRMFEIFLEDKSFKVNDSIYEVYYLFYCFRCLEK